MASARVWTGARALVGATLGIVGALACLAAAQAPLAPAARRHLVIVVDGLRPDDVTPEVMPALVALGRRGVVFTRHHSVFPTVTRVNGASIATGAYPDTHGLMGNSVYLPRVDAARFLDTASRDALLRVIGVEGRLLTARTMGEVIRASGRQMLVISSGSAGSAILNDPTLDGVMLHADFTVPESRREDLRAIGEPPSKDGPAAARDRYAVDALLKIGLPRVDPAVTVLWLGALDATSHANAPGHPATVAVLQQVDHEIARVQEGLSAAGLLDAFDIWVTSDHGFSTHTGAVPIDDLIAPYAGAMADGTPAVVAGSGAIHVRQGGDATVSAIVRGLQARAGVGAIFTRARTPGSPDGVVPGTLSFDVVRWQHARSGQILYSPDWTDAPNAHGAKGVAASGGVAGHGSSSPRDVHNTLIAAGPDLRRGVTIDVPTSNVDLAPTLLGLIGLDVPSTMQGRPLDEARASARRAAPAVSVGEQSARTPDGSYAVMAQVSRVRVGAREYRYFDSARVTRRP